jgi:hypothetical protein
MEDMNMPKKKQAEPKPAKPEAPKPGINKAEKKKLEKVSETVVFWCNDGQVFRDMQELMDGLDKMSDATFSYHLNNIKNDFSCWVMDIIGDDKLAQDLKTVKNREQAKNKVKQRYIELTQLEG